MKDRLTKEESAHLISLGVPKEKASVRHIELTLEEYRVFNLTDLLEILPKEIDYSNFYMIWDGEEWHVGYQHYNGDELYPSSDLDFESFKAKKELIDALYELCAWCLKNKYLKFEQP